MRIFVQDQASGPEVHAKKITTPVPSAGATGQAQRLGEKTINQQTHRYDIDKSNPVFCRIFLSNTHQKAYLKT